MHMENQSFRELLQREHSSQKRPLWQIFVHRSFPFSFNNCFEKLAGTNARQLRLGRRNPSRAKGRHVRSESDRRLRNGSQHDALERWEGFKTAFQLESIWRNFRLVKFYLFYFYLTKKTKLI